MSVEDPELLNLYHGVWTIVNKSYSQKAHIALIQLQNYVNGAIIQYSRYSKTKETSPFGTERKKQMMEAYQKDLKARQNNEPYDESLKIARQNDDWFKLLQLHLDAHFFLICADKVQNLIKRIAEFDDDTRLQELYKKVQARFKPFNDARNHFEHIDREIKEEKSKLGLYSSDGELFRFRIRGKDWGEVEINESSLKLIRDTYDELLIIFRTRPDRVEWKPYI